MSALDRPTDVALILGASARLTRFVTVDDLGQWWIREPLHRRFVDTSAEKYLIGLHCPHCAGFHASLLVIASYALARVFRLLPLWRIVAGALAVNYVTAHASSHLDWQDDEDGFDVEEEDGETSLPREVTPPPPAAIGETVHVMERDVCTPGMIKAVTRESPYLAHIRCEQEETGLHRSVLCAYDNGRAPVTEHEELLGGVYYPHGDRWFSSSGWHLVEECPTARAKGDLP